MLVQRMSNAALRSSSCTWPMSSQTTNSDHPHPPRIPAAGGASLGHLQGGMLAAIDPAAWSKGQRARHQESVAMHWQTLESKHNGTEPADTKHQVTLETRSHRVHRRPCGPSQAFYVPMHDPTPHSARLQKSAPRSADLLSIGSENETVHGNCLAVPLITKTDLGNGGLPRKPRTTLGRLSVGLFEKSII